MKKLFVLFLFTILQLYVYAQPSIQWQKCLGGTGDDYSFTTQQTTDGGYIMAGYTTSNNGDVSGNHGGDDIWIVKTDSLGNLQWQKCLGGSLNEMANSIKQTIDGGYILAGETYSNDGDVSGNHGWRDVWVVKLDSIGNIEWQKCLGGLSGESANSIQLTTDGGFLMAGFTDSNDGDVNGSHGLFDAWVVKLNNLGTIQWQKCLGGTGDEWLYYNFPTTDGGFITTGFTDSNDGDVSGNHGWRDAWVVKLDSIGNIQWQKCLGGTDAEFGHSIKQTTDGGYILIGLTLSNDGDVIGNHGDYDAWVIKLDSIGNIDWQKCLGGSASDYAYSIAQSTDAGYILVGSAYSVDGDVNGNHGNNFNDAWVVKLDSIGNVDWQKCLGGTYQEVGYSLQFTIDGGYVLTGFTGSNNGDVSGNHGNNSIADVWVVKLSSTVGMDELSSITSLNVYPNPVSDKLTINLSLSKTENLTLQLKNVLGQTVIEPIYLKNSSGTFTHAISTSKLPNGIYLLDIMGEEGRRTEKIVVEH